MGLGFRAKVVAVASIPILVVVAIFTWYFPRREERAADKALEQRALFVAQALAPIITTAVDLDSQDAVVQQALEVRERAGLAYVLVLRPDGSVFARQRDDRDASEGDELRKGSEVVRVERRGRFLHVLLPLEKEEETEGGKKRAVLGTLVVGFSRDAIITARGESQKTALLVGLGVLVAAFGLSFLGATTLVRPLVQSSRELSGLSAELVAGAREQEASAAQSAAAVEETRRIMETLVNSAQEISDRCSAVLGNAEHSLQGNRVVAERIAELNVHSEKVAEILAAIMQVADRTDLLALNAALEGTKAGEAGRGFTLVAAEMRRLAENVMESVAGIRRLLKDVKAASLSTVEASAEGIRLSEETTGSARDIALVTQTQRKATEQVGVSMDEMTQLLNHNVETIQQVTRSAATLSEMAARLMGVVNPKGARNGVTPASGDGAVIALPSAKPPAQPPAATPVKGESIGRRSREPRA